MSRPGDGELVGPLAPALAPGALDLAAAAADAGARAALIGDDATLDFAALERRARTRAAGLPATRPHAFVGAVTVDAVVELHAALIRRVALAPLSPRLSEPGRAELARRAVAGPADAGAILFTSGSSGQPKAVVLSRAALAASAAASTAALGLGPDDRWLCALPLGHVGGLSIALRCLAARAAVVLGGPARFDPAALLERVRRHRVSLVSLVPTQLAGLVDAGLASPPGLRVVLGGAASPAELLARARAAGYAVITTYGMTETASMAALDGRPLPGVALRVHGGRIAVRGAVVLDGYLPPDRAGLDAGWFDTGDLGAIARDRLEVIGRADDTIITGGENVHPTEVEAVLAALPEVRAACVFGLADPRWGQLVACALVTRDGARPAGLDAALAGLPSFQRPRRLALVSALALGPTGKLDRRATAVAVADLLVAL